MNAHLLDRLLDMHVWQTGEIVFGALGAVLLVLGILWRKVLIPMRKALALLRDIGDQLLGDDDPRHPTPSMSDRIDALHTTVDGQGQQLTELQRSFGEHLEQHSVYDRPNGPRFQAVRRDGQRR